MMDIGDGKVQFRNYLKHQAQQKKRQRNGCCNNHCTKYICHHQNIYPGLMRVCHYMLHQTISIRQTFSIYPYDIYEKKIYEYALNIVHIVSRYKGSYQLITTNSREVGQAFQRIYENTLITYPKTLMIDIRWKGILWRHNEINGKA